jgi:hypothetical protein
MATIELFGKTRLDFPEFQMALDRAFTRSFAASVLTKWWTGTTLNVAGPNCRGTASFQGGTLKGPIELGWPATMLSGRICDDIARMLRAAGCDEVRVG